jgi:hypothetical protein
MTAAILSYSVDVKPPAPCIYDSCTFLSFLFSNILCDSVRHEKFVSSSHGKNLLVGTVQLLTASTYDLKQINLTLCSESRVGFWEHDDI